MEKAGGRPKLMQRPERRRALMTAAAEAFARRGFAATSLDDVAAQAGVSRVLIYRHFDSKAQLYEAVLDDVGAQLMAATGGPGQLGPGSLVALLDVAQANPAGFRLFFRHAGQEPEFRDHAAWLRTAMTQTTEPHLRQMLPDHAKRRWAAQLVPVAVVEAVIAWLDAGRPHPERAAATIGAMVMGLVDAIAKGGSWTES
ncbi:MAG: TetR/AcrR family transcriptional regulator [Jiangellaceae bacterium]